jgi:hypothetical protein
MSAPRLTLFSNKWSVKMALGKLILDETGNVTSNRVLSMDENSHSVEVNLILRGSIDGVKEETLWTYTALTRSDGSIYGTGNGLMNISNGDVIRLIGHGTGRVLDNGIVRFSTMLHPHTNSESNKHLNYIALVGEYEVQSDGTATNKCWEWQ